jgi:hypothetical protein
MLRNINSLHRFFRVTLAKMISNFVKPPQWSIFNFEIFIGSMVGGKGAHGTSRFIRRLRMCRALGIQYSRAMPPASRTRGRDRRRGTWWNLEKHCVAIEGKDFAQDTQEGGADQFELIPDSEEGGDNGPSLLGGDDEFVPETEPQDNAAVSKARPRLG